MSYNLTISWTAAVPAPANGYRIKYWPTSSPASITTVSPNPTSSPYTITGLTELSYEGTIESSCGGGLYSTPVPFNGTVPTPTITTATAGFQPCIGGTIDDHLGGSIVLSGPVAVDTPFQITVTYYTPGGTCSSTSTAIISGTVLAGDNTASIDGCGSGGVYISTGGTVCTAVGELL